MSCSMSCMVGRTSRTPGDELGTRGKLSVYLHEAYFLGLGRRSSFTGGVITHIIREARRGWRSTRSMQMWPRGRIPGRDLRRGHPRACGGGDGGMGRLAGFALGFFLCAKIFPPNRKRAIDPPPFVF